MPVRTDAIKRIRIDECAVNVPVRLAASDIDAPVWIKGSDPPLGGANITAEASAGYVFPLADFMPRSLADPSQALEPTPGTQTAETTRFTRYVLLAYASSARTVLAAAAIAGTGHIYVDVASITYYYRMYAKLAKTADFSTFTDVTTETTIMTYSRGSATAAGWYDEGAIAGSVRAKVALDAGEALLLALRGTSWNTSGYKSSIGIKSTNLKVFAAVLA